MIKHRNDPMPRQLMITALIILNVIVIREEFTATGEPGWLNTICFLITAAAIFGQRYVKS